MPVKPKDRIRFTDLGNARRFVRKHAQNAKFCRARNQWLRWDSRRWAVDQDDGVNRLAEATVMAIFAEAAAARDKKLRGEIAQWARSSESRYRISAMVELAKARDQIAIRPDVLDTDPYALLIPV